MSSSRCVYIFDKLLKFLSKDKGVDKTQRLMIYDCGIYLKLTQEILRLRSMAQDNERFLSEIYVADQQRSYRRNATNNK